MHPQDKALLNFFKKDKQINIAHIINPVQASRSSDLYIAQSVTFETMKTAKIFADGTPVVDLLAACYPEDSGIVPDYFTRLDDLNGSVLDIIQPQKKRKLPLIKDILNIAYNYSNADYFIYTNVDIALQPYFYRVVGEIVNQGYDAFIINRRTIPAHYKNTEEIPLMYAEIGQTHPGWDCFIFKRDLYPHFILGNACIGTDWIGRMMISNMVPLAKKFKVFKNLQMTFHIGNDRVWKTEEFSDYAAHNKEESRKTLMAFDKKYGPFDRKSLPGRFLNHFEETKSKRTGMTKKEILNHIVFVGGSPRSGTTFAARSLNLHPGFIAAIDDHVYECWGLYQYRKRCGLIQEIRERSLMPEDARHILAKYLFANACLVGAAPSDKTKGFSLVDSSHSRFPGFVRSALDNELLRYSVPLTHFSNQWRLCLKSPEISFVLPDLAGFFPHAKFVLVYRPIIEIANSMYRIGNLVKRFPVYHRRWLEEKSPAGDFIPPAGVPSEWKELWQTVSDFQRCVIYAASYIDALLLGIKNIDAKRYFIYNHNNLCESPRHVFQQLAKFLSVEISGFEAAEAELKGVQPLLPSHLFEEYDKIENKLCLEPLMNKIESLSLTQLKLEEGA